MSVDALHRPARRQEGRRGLPARTMSEQSQLDDILQDLLADPMFLNNSRSYEWANDAEGTYGSISPQQGSITTHSGHGGRTVVSWQMNQTGPKNASVAVTRKTVDRPSPNSYVESESSRRLETTASARPASADRTGSRYESRRVETRTEATTRRDGMTSTSSMSSSSSKPQPPSPPVRRRLFNPEAFNHDSPVRSAPVPPPRREVPPPETASRTPMHFQSAPSTPSTPHRNYVTSDNEDGSSRWLDEQRNKMVQSSSSRQQKVYRAGPATVVQSDTEDYFRPAAPERRSVSRSQMESPSRWATNAYDDPNFSDSGISPRRLYGSQSAVHSRSADTRAYDLESGRLFETKKSFFVSGIERPADRTTQTKYTFSVSPQRSLTGDEFPTSPPRNSRPPPRPITPSRTCTSPVLPPLRTDSSREAVMRVNMTRDFVSPKPTRDVHSPTLDELEKSLQDFHSLLQAPPVPKPAPSPSIDELVVANKLKLEESAMPPEEEEEEEEVISLQPIGPGVQNLEPDEPLRQRSVTPGFPGFSSEAVTPVTPPFPATKRTPYTNTNQGFSSSSNITTPTTPNLAATSPVNDVSRYIEEFATLTETNTLQRTPPVAPPPRNQQLFSNMDDQATLTRQSAAANQNAPQSTVGNTDSEMHIYQTPRRQYSQPQTISEQRQQTLTYQQQPQQPQQQQQGLNFQQSITANQQQTSPPQQQQQQYQYQINEQSQHGFAVPYQYDQQQQQQQVNTSASVQKSQPIAVIEQVEHQQQVKQAYTQRGSQSTGIQVENPGSFGSIAAGGGAASSASSVQYRTTSSSASVGGGQTGTTVVDGQWNQVHGQPVTVQDGSRILQQFGLQQQSSTMSNKRSGMVLDTAVAGSATTPRALSPSTLPAPHAVAARNRSISPSDMTLRARLQSRLESRSPGMAMMAGGAGGQTSPSVYFGTSRTGSLSSLNDGEVLLQSPRFVRDTSKLWHKPHITREEAITLLKDKPPGSFVVRNSNTFQGAFGLALKVAQIPPNVQIKEGVDPQSELVRHFLIEPTSKGVRLKGCTNEPVFGSLAALVYQHTITPLALPCKLLLPEFDIAGADATDSTLTGTANKSLLYVQGAACNVLYINSIDMESLTGPEALSRAIATTFPSNGPPPYATDVHFKVSSEGITLTDNKHRLFFRRHYPINTVTFCGVDARDRRWTLKFDDNQTMDCKVFGFVARKSGSNADNACHVFAEMDPNQPANAIVNFLTKVMIGQGHFMKT